jgi:hypothetical protein
MRAISTDREALKHWDEYRRNILRATEVPFETEGDKQKRIDRLKGNYEEFCKYYFPNYCTAEFAKFQLQFAKKIIDNETIYAVAAWAREHAKSVNAGLFLPIFLAMTGKLQNMLVISHSYDNAAELLMPIMVNLESNQRLINDYGQQKGWRSWETGRIITTNSISFRAIGAGQSPRGTRNEEKRPDFILIDDIDTDRESRNQDQIEKKWKWIEQALLPSMSISGKKRIVFVGNIIAKNGCITKAIRVSDFHQIINILDKNGKPSWTKNSMADIQYMLSKISYASGQKEYFNNPISEGTVFKDIKYGKVPPLSKFKYLVCYTDPSFKDSKKNDFKATVLIGEHDGTFYIIKAYVEQTTTAQMIKWHYDIADFVKEKSVVYYYLEQVFLQDIFFAEFQKAGKASGKYIPIQGDDRSKPDKFSRIEANLEPLNRRGLLVFNEAMKDDPHMMRLEEQFKSIEPSLPAHDDGPDAVEGGIYIINNKLRVMDKITVGVSMRNKHKY